MKLVYLVADGMSGWPVESLGGRTTLEAAHTPTLDALARRSMVGRCITVPEGMPPGSDVANMALLGFDPTRFHTGRGPIEAAAQGIDLAPEDLVWRMNLVRVSAFAPEGIMEDYSAGHIDTPTATALIQKLQASVPDGIEIFPGVQYRHLLVQRGASSSAAATAHIRPPHDILGASLAPDLETLSQIPDLARVATQAHILLRDTAAPANAIWPWGQGRPLHLPSFAATFGLQGAVITAVDLVRGLGRAAGMDAIHVPGATGLLDTNYAGKVQAGVDFLAAGGQFLYLHVEAPDECGHMGDVQGKVEAIERFDARIVAPMLAALKAMDEPFVLVVTCDHATPIARRTHVADPVPFLLFSSRHPATGPATLSENTASSGPLLPSGPELLALALAHSRGLA